MPADVRSWIRAQHAAWTHLRPQQQQLLTDPGITPGSEEAAGLRRRTSRVYPASPGLTHARAYAQVHGHLSPSADTHHDGFPLGRWLVQTRRKARQGRLSPATTHTLETIDPWWNPPWPHTWQRTYQQAKLHQLNGQLLTSLLLQWTDRQRTRWAALHPDQQQFLTSIGIHPG